ncbi:MAG: 4Fe-4S binding protein [Planctomycetota bacterium]|nr:MAG: 4Fe-4S binding protein [Planctomycetota bacterium]
MAIGSRKSGRAFSPLNRAIIFTPLFWICYQLAARSSDAALWLTRLDSPVFVAFVVLAVPTIYMPRRWYYKVFLILPAAMIVLAVVDVFRQYSRVPEGAGFAWFLVKPAYLIAATTGFLIICQYFLSLGRFRKVTRITMLLLLIYGGFAFRQNYIDYKDALARRSTTSTDIMLIAETVPVLKGDNKVTHVPAAPCRFSADGGYVQGCPMELLQRLFQVNTTKVAQADMGETSAMAISLAAVLFIAVLCFISARWWCGWICPLSTLGDIFDTIRRWFGLPHLKTARPINLAYLFTGLSLGSFGLLLAKLYPHIDEQGKFMGCKIPVYPFCKICPGQQVCPVASQGLGAYPGLPTWDWLYGFFKIACFTLLVLYLASFAVGRRLWCRLCPMGMINGIFNRGGLISLKKDAQKCNKCAACNEVCPMDIHTVAEEMEKEDVSSFDCVYCMRCVENCPQDKCLRIEFAGKTLAESEFRTNINES